MMKTLSTGVPDAVFQLHCAQFWCHSRRQRIEYVESVLIIRGRPERGVSSRTRTIAYL